MSWKLAALKQEGQGVTLPSAGVARPSRRLKKRVLRGGMELAAYKDTSKQTRNAHAVVFVSFGTLLVQRDQWDTYWGLKKVIF